MSETSEVVDTQVEFSTPTPPTDYVRLSCSAQGIFYWQIQARTLLEVLEINRQLIKEFGLSNAKLREKRDR